MLIGSNFSRIWRHAEETKRLIVNGERVLQPSILCRSGLQACELFREFEAVL